MNAATGQNLRRAGLVLEALCMFGLVALARGKLGAWKAGGPDPSVVLSVGLGLGFLLWLVGTVALHRARRKG